MHLRTLTLRGFKSFASSTTLHFEPGINAVVGPNGSGKSNVVDALSWVMGEQGAKTLRGGNMADVIFAGTSSRPPLGRAEVSLTIDNSDGALPIEYTEVTISRTLFRAGGSEYAINGSSCRLLDVQELLSDTGMGREMHVIVGQGRLDSVLQATPEDRRGFIEEAAGVLKHRRRKDKAVRKLEAMAANVARVTDLTAEIRRQLGPLARQADVARRAARVQSDLRDSKARLLADDLVQLSGTLAQDEADEKALLERRAEVEKAQSEARHRLADLERAAAQAAPRLSEATEVWYKLTEQRERLRSLGHVAAERYRLLGHETAAEEDGPSDRPEELEQQAAAVRREEAALGTEIAAAQQVLDRAVSERGAAEEAQREAEQALAAVHRGLADRREGLARLTGQVSSRRSRLESAEAELGRLRESLASARERARSAEAEFARLEQQVAGVEEGEEGLDEAHESAVAEMEAAQAEVSALVEAERAAEADRSTWAARRDTLELSLRRKDGTGALLEAGGPGVLGSLAEHLSVQAGWENAVAAALGQYADAAVVESPETAVDAIRRSREDDAGQVRLVVAAAGQGGAEQSAAEQPGTEHPAARRPAAQEPAGQQADVSGPGVAALDVVTPSDALGRTLVPLLAATRLVEDLAEARQVIAGDGALVAVTREGDLLASHSARGGTTGEASVLALQAAYEEAVREAEAATGRVEQTRFALRPARERVEAAKSVAQGTLDALHASDARHAAVAEELGRHGSSLRSAEAEIERAQPAIARAEAEISEHQREVEALAERLEQAQKEPAQSEEELTERTTAREAATAATAAARSAETEARLGVRTLEERARALADRGAALEAAAEEERAARAKAAEAAARRAAEAEAAAEVRAGAERAVGYVETAVAEAAAERERAETERTEREQAMAEVRAAAEEISGELARLTDAAHRDEMARAQQRMKIEQLTERAIAELGLNPEILVEEYGPDKPVPAPPADGEEEAQERPYVRAEQEKRLKAAQRDLARLGKVNPLALEEHAALEERHQFLADQLADLEKSRQDLLSIIREVDERVARVFSEAYHETAQAFEAVFSRLFPGGEGRLVLTDPEYMLTTGIEVEARPAGKKVKRLSLLSGGERSLVAVAFLVAIFKARPSPFYVLDEVEAALDDTNLGRLLEIFRELQSTSQLVIITHQKRTMEIADALYGVTMRGDGVTTVISQRLEREHDPV